MFGDDSDVAKRIDRSIMDLIIVDMLPYSVVEGTAFKRLNFFDPAGPRRYKPKSEKYYRTTLMPSTYEAVVQHMKKLLLEAEWVSFTTDVWTNPTNTCSLLSFTGHFVHQSMRRKVILSVMELEADHTGEYLASKLKDAINMWNLQDKVHLGVRDNGANIVCAMRLAEIADIGCVSHTLQLVIHDALFTQTSVEAVIKKSRRIVTHFKHSEQACRKLEDCQKSCGTPSHKLLQDVETRWNSSYIMLERLIEQKRAVDLFSVEQGGISTLSASEWELAERIVHILQPFYAATLELSSDDSCISIIVPLTVMLLGKLQSTSDDHGLLQLKAALRDCMNRRFAHVKQQPHIIAATLLDPRFKDAYFTAEEKAAAKTEIVKFLRSVQRGDYVGGASDDQPSTSSQAYEMPTAGNSSMMSLWEAHDNLQLQQTSPTDENETIPLYEQELTSYLKETRLPRSTDVYAFWHCSQYASLTPAARKYLSAPPTSVASEQLFSAAGQLDADRRTNLHGHNAEKLLFLAYNIPLFGFNY